MGTKTTSCHLEQLPAVTETSIEKFFRAICTPWNRGMGEVLSVRVYAALSSLLVSNNTATPPPIYTHSRMNIGLTNLIFSIWNWNWYYLACVNEFKLHTINPKEMIFDSSVSSRYQSMLTALQLYLSRRTDSNWRKTVMGSRCYLTGKGWGYISPGSLNRLVSLNSMLLLLIAELNIVIIATKGSSAPFSIYIFMFSLVITTIIIRS